MAIIPFSQQSGFKLLATAHLEKSHYSLIMYLLNCVASGFEEILTTESELSSLIGFTEEEISEALITLREKKLIRIKVGDYNYNNHNTAHTSISLTMEFDTSKWKLQDKATKDQASDAIIYPFRRGGKADFRVVEGEQSAKNPSQRDKTWERVLNAFCTNRSLDDEEVEQATRDAQLLAEAHSIDQILLILRHFGERIPTLSLLASNWQHYLEILVQETQHVDLIGARQKHIELDQLLRTRAMEVLQESQELSDEEKQVLTILGKHRYPRRQLFWAYQSRSRYPSLQDFFENNKEMMIAVTTSGTIVPKR